MPPARRVGVTATAGVALLALTLLTAVSPAAGVVTAGALIGLAGAWAYPPGVLLLVLRVAAASIALLVLAATISFFPVVGLVAGASALGGLMAWRMRDRLRAPALALLRVLAVPGIPVTVLALGVGLAVWPVTTALAALVAFVLVLAWRAPPWALAFGVGLIAFEGSVKILLQLEPTPLPPDARAVGAAAIDLALFGSVAGLVVADRGRTPRAIWARASRGERVALGLIVGWLLLSVLQIPVGGDPGRGVSGFRLTQAYAAVALATAIVAIGARPIAHVSRAVVVVGGLVALYAAVRVGIGPAAAEAEFATSVRSTTYYGDKIRAVGSFSSSVGMISFLTPLAVFALVTGYLVARIRLLAWATAALAVIGILASYGRGALFGVLAGLCFGLVAVLVIGDLGRRGKLLAAVFVIAVVGTTYAGVQLASRDSEALEERAQGVLRPGQDESVLLRIGTWEEVLDEVAKRPLGHGVGAVGAASADRSLLREGVRTTDNSFLKILYEQGVQGLVLFLGGLLALLAVLTRRLVAHTGERRAVGLAALAGVVAFLALSVTGEYVEQPGKVVAWGLLGLAAGTAFSSPSRTEEGA